MENKIPLLLHERMSLGVFLHAVGFSNFTVVGIVLGKEAKKTFTLECEKRTGILRRIF